MATNSRTYTDLDLNFIANPVTGDVSVKTDAMAIKQSIRNLISTNHYERLFHPEIGSQVSALLFEQFSPLTKVMLEKSIQNTIINHEPRVKLENVRVALNNDDATAYITIVFTIANTNQPVSLDMALRRTR